MRRSGLTITLNRLQVLGGMGAFKCGRKDGAPSLKTPVNLVSLDQWLGGSLRKEFRASIKREQAKRAERREKQHS